MPSDVMYKDKKWMWDGVDYPSEEEVLQKVKKKRIVRERLFLAKAQSAQRES
jgi:hypothetical protein